MTGYRWPWKDAGTLFGSNSRAICSPIAWLLQKPPASRNAKFRSSRVKQSVCRSRRIVSIFLVFHRKRIESEANDAIVLCLLRIGRERLSFDEKTRAKDRVTTPSGSDPIRSDRLRRKTKRYNVRVTSWKVGEPRYSSRPWPIPRPQIYTTIRHEIRNRFSWIFLRCGCWPAVGLILSYSSFPLRSRADEYSKLQFSIVRISKNARKTSRSVQRYANFESESKLLNA